LIPQATLERRTKSAARRLSGNEGDCLARLAKVYVLGLDIYRDSASAREFLKRPHAMLESKSPVDGALATDPGADAVINLLGGVVYGSGTGAHRRPIVP
jgi:putative toxin-antitoxin system antitoxin component (TIGR02293 family)